MIYETATKKTTLLLKGSVRKRGEYSVSVSPDRTRLIVNTYQFGGWKLGIADFNGQSLSNFKKFTSRRNYEYSAMWSYEGSRVAFQEYNWSTNDTEIFISDHNGRNVEQFTNSPGGDRTPAWTQDNTELVFTSGRGNNYDIYLKPITSGEAKNLTNNPSTDFAPSTSAANNSIAFLSDRTGNINLYTMDYDGGSMINLTPALKSSVKSGAFDRIGLWAYKTSWSPDGSQIVFCTMTGSGVELFIVNKDGSGLVQITNNNDSDFCPYWLD
ncbi:MAG: hypothetical protein ABJP45_05085 [Cyclobacteriaceae bacterium]